MLDEGVRSWGLDSRAGKGVRLHCGYWMTRGGTREMLVERGEVVGVCLYVDGELAALLTSRRVVRPANMVEEIPGYEGGTVAGVLSRPRTGLRAILRSTRSHPPRTDPTDAYFPLDSLGRMHTCLPHALPTQVDQYGEFETAVSDGSKTMG